MKRSEIESKYKWRLEDLFEADGDWEESFKKIGSDMAKVNAYAGKLNKKQTLLECLKFSDDVEMRLYSLFFYAHMRSDEDARENTYAAMLDRATGLLIKYNSVGSFVRPELAAQTEEYLSDCANSPEFKDYDFQLRELIRTKKHILSGAEEKLLAMAQGPLSGISKSFSMLNDVDLPLPMLNLGGDKKEKLTHGKYSYHLEHGDAATRRKVFKGMYGAIKQMINVTAGLYSSSVKSDNFYAQAKGFNSAMEKELFGDNVPKAVYENLIAAVSGGLKSVHEYVELRKQVLGGGPMHVYDMYMPLVPGTTLAESYEDAFNTVVEGLKPLGKRYHELLKESGEKQWIDVFENEGKRSGAYCMGVFGCHPYVLLNYSNTSHDVFTIAHELGHAMHSYFSNENQPFAKSNYEIFAAEVASTVNEVLLLKHLLSVCKDKKTRVYLLNYYLMMFRTTLFRQTQFAEFEMIVHKMDQNGEALTPEKLSDKYYRLNKKYYGKGLTHDKEIRYEWARIPHFYNAFYVYKYSTGITAAVSFAKKIIADPSFKDVYISSFLSAGGSDSAYNILKRTGVDLATKEPYETAMQEFTETLAELKKLI